MADPVVLSGSALQTFLKCPAMYRYGHLEQIKAPPSIKGVRGIAVHRGVEINFAQKIESKIDLPLDHVLDAYSDSFDEGARDAVLGKSDDPIPAIKDGGVKLVKLHHAEVAPTIQPLMVEESVQYQIGGHEISGYLDLVDEAPGHTPEDPKIRVRDTKTTSRRPSGNAFLVQITGYALGIRQKTGLTEADTILDYLVATKDPYYLQLSLGGPVDGAAIRAFSTEVDIAYKMISAGLFPATGIQSPGLCAFCGYSKGVCAVGSRMVRGQ